MGLAKMLNRRWGSKTGVPVIRARVILGGQAGFNRQARREKIASARNAPMREAKYQAHINAELDAHQRQQKVERRVLRATTRRMERESAAQKGLPVKYSIA